MSPTMALEDSLRTNIDFRGHFESIECLERRTETSRGGEKGGI